MLRVEYNYGTLFVFNPRTQNNWQYNNATGADVTVLIGTIMGRVDATGYLKPMVSTATDGSQRPIGILIATTVFPAGAATNCTILVQGDVVAPGIVFANGTDTLTTNITQASGDIIGTINDLLTGRGILPVPSTENTFYDN